MKTSKIIFAFLLIGYLFPLHAEEKKENITTSSLETILKRMQERTVTRATSDTTLIKLLELLQDVLAQMKEVNISLKEVAITTEAAGLAAKIASDQLDLLLGEE